VVREGARATFVAEFLGRTLEYTYEIVELIPLERLVMRTATGPFPMETTYEWEDTPAGATRMTLRNRGEPVGFAAIAAPVLAGAMRRANVRISSASSPFSKGEQGSPDGRSACMRHLRARPATRLSAQRVDRR
jgi:hypothetical protein